MNARHLPANALAKALGPAGAESTPAVHLPPTPGQLVSCKLPTRWGEFDLHGLVDAVTGAEHAAMSLGRLDDGEPVLTDVDLTLAGHTHGGQIRIRGKAPLHHSKFGFEQGWFREGDARLYVSRGVGVTFLPIRIDAPPEIPIVTMVARTVNEAKHVRSGQNAEHRALADAIAGDGDAD